MDLGLCKCLISRGIKNIESTTVTHLANVQARDININFADAIGRFNIVSFRKARDININFADAIGRFNIVSFRNQISVKKGDIQL